MKFLYNNIDYKGNRIYLGEEKRIKLVSIDVTFIQKTKVYNNAVLLGHILVNYKEELLDKIKSGVKNIKKYR